MTAIALSRRRRLRGPDGMTSKLAYRISTAVITLVMLFSLYKMFSPDYAHLGLPSYLRLELAVAKLLGLAALLAPRVPAVLREWAYAGFAIVLVSASVAHYASGDGVPHALEPLGFLAVLLISRRAWGAHKARS